MANEEKSFEARLDLVPTSPGVYLMKDASGSVIYVGKAVNLRQRLRSYFTPNPQGTEKVLAMISEIRDFDFLLCQNELETLILESNLIKRYNPFYNILLKDDRDYPYIRVTLNELYPRVMKAYRVGSDKNEGAKYYGPYLSGDLKKALKTIHAIFPLKTCKRVFPRDIGKQRPCLNYYMNKCIAPCLGTVSAERYRAVIDEVCEFLEGRYDGILSRLEEEMNEASEALNFEKAAVLRDRLSALRKLQEKQRAVLDTDFDGDVLGIARNNAEVCVLKLEVRSGKITGTSTYFIDAPASSDEDILTAFIEQYYPAAAYVPPIILTSVPSLADESRSPGRELSRLLGELVGRKVRLHFPQRGEKREVLSMADANAKQTLQRRTLIAGSNQQSIDAALRLLGRIVGLGRPPARIEAYDISNSGSEDIACGMAVFENGRARASQSRIFNIRHQDGQDDYAAMAEAVDRRLARLGDKNFGARPDLILADGGLGHVRTVEAVLRAHGIEDIALAGMVKDKRHRTRGLVLPNGVTVELEQSLGMLEDAGSDAGSSEELSVWFSSDPGMERAQKLSLLRLLAAVQNETHRLAGKATRRLHKRRQSRYRLEQIPGIGPARRKKLLKAFRSLKEISESSAEEILERVPSLGEKTAQAVYDYFHQNEEEG